jgi:ankyrin repeat protein
MKVLTAPSTTPDQDLLHAIGQGDAAGVAIALSHQANPDAVDSKGNTAIRLAALFYQEHRWTIDPGYLKMIRQLLDAGANPAISNHAKQNAINVTVDFEDRSLLKLFEPYTSEAEIQALRQARNSSGSRRHEFATALYALGHTGKTRE